MKPWDPHPTGRVLPWSSIAVVSQYAVECSNLDVMPDVTFTINGLPYLLSAQAYTVMVRLRSTAATTPSSHPLGWKSGSGDKGGPEPPWELSRVSQRLMSPIASRTGPTVTAPVCLRVRKALELVPALSFSFPRSTATAWPSVPAASRG